MSEELAEYIADYVNEEMDRHDFHESCYEAGIVQGQWILDATDAYNGGAR